MLIAKIFIWIIIFCPIIILWWVTFININKYTTEIYETYNLLKSLVIWCTINITVNIILIYTMLLYTMDIYKKAIIEIEADKLLTAIDTSVIMAMV